MKTKNKKHKNIGLLAISLLASLASLSVISSPNSAFAESGCYDDVDIKIVNGAISYSPQVDTSTISYVEGDHTGTLTLNGFQGSSFCSDNTELTLILHGENAFSNFRIYGLTTTVEGDGTLNLTAEYDPKIDYLVLNSGTINLIRDSSAYDTAEFDTIIIKGGKLNSAIPIEAEFFYQEGGELNIQRNTIEVDREGEGLFYCLIVDFVASFNGGVTNINCSDAPALLLYIDDDDNFYNILNEINQANQPSSRYYNYTVVDGVILKITFNGETVYFPNRGFVAFNDGDVTLKSNVASLILLGDASNEEMATELLEEKGKDFFFSISDKLTIDPTVARGNSIVDSRDNQDTMIKSTFASDEDSISISGDTAKGFTTSGNVLKNVHIYQMQNDDKPDVPKTDDTPKAGNHGFSTVANSSVQSDFTAITILAMILSLPIVSFIKKVKEEQEN